MPPPPGYDPNSGMPPPPPVPEPAPAPAPDEPRTVLGDVPHPDLRAPVPGPEPGAPAPEAKPERRLSSDMFEIEPGTLPPHRFAALFPLMTPHEHAELRHAIEVCGQQVLAVRFQNQLLDGRNRDIACKEVGINLRIVDYLGTEEEAFDYVMNANRFHRDLSASQRAAIGAELLEHITPDLEKRRLEKIKASPKTAFLKDQDTQDIACYRLLVAIEAALGLCFHLCAKRLKKVPGEYAECFALMADAEIISSDLSERLQRMARFRNLLIHMYWKIDYDKVYEIIRDDLKDLRDFSSAIVSLL